MKGVNTSNTTCTVALSKPLLRMKRRANVATSPSTSPSAMPPKKLARNVAVASSSEKVPVTAAAMANWKDTTPEASLMSASPESSVFCRLVRLMSLPRAVTATASVGPSAAPMANAAAKGMEGSIQCRTKPTTSTVARTRPTAKERMAPLFCQSARLLACRASSKSNGAMNSTKNSSGSMFTCRGVPAMTAMTMPRAICTRGSDTRGIIWSRTEDTSTAPSSRRTSSSISMEGFSFRRVGRRGFSTAS